ncbi:MAG: CDP-diacylglycerol--glycerol-3-phosphate 3-phosphatidyltransferase [Candidatus Omnitrophica bacterium]|nr:CDP-diacylglycerol--glycerol-3-phosphate 3-phosphatidyltransferase [Candidatus Omnitrophota bacterium]
MNLPNRLTILRIVLSFVFMFLLFFEGILAKVLALFVFAIASLTDFYDGYIARKYNLITDLGKFLDPIADKILVLAAFLAFVQMRIVPAWMVVVIILRELLITGIRIHSMTKGKVLAAARGGKHKTISQMVAICVILTVVILKELGLSVFGFWNENYDFWSGVGISVLMLVTVVFTVVSGVSYLIMNKNELCN